MKCLPSLRSSILGFCAVGALATASLSHATLLVYDGFASDGLEGSLVNGESMVARTISGGAIGVVGNYGRGGSGTPIWNSQGLTFSNLIVSGGMATLTTTTSATTLGGAFANTINHTGTLYHSYLVNLSTGGGTGTMYSRVNGTSGATSDPHFIASADAAGASTVPNVAYGTTTGTSAAGSSTMAANTTYLVVARYTNVGSTLTTENPGVATLWVLTESQFDFFQIGGFTDAAFDLASVGTGNNQIFAKATSTQTTGGFSFSGNGTGNMSYNFFWTLPNADALFAVDEIRYGTTLDSVMPIPEPGTLALIAIGLAVILFRLRRQSPMA